MKMLSIGILFKIFMFILEIYISLLTHLFIENTKKNLKNEVKNCLTNKRTYESYIVRR